ncbi:MAG: hypothetical protein ACHQFZ_08325 [Acidimicrobiales bacterium]
MSSRFPSPARRDLWPYVSLTIALAAIALWVISIHRARFLHMGALGLVSLVGPFYFAGLALVIGGLGIEILSRRRSDTRVLLFVLLLILFLFATASAIEPVAALGDSWYHAGIVQYILQHGHPLNGYDARFSWPGGFSLGAVFVSLTGQANAIGFLRWFPLFVEVLYLFPVLSIARSSGVSWRTRWVAVALFYATDWIYQDYFSPQALNYFFYLVVIAGVLACLQPQRRLRIAWAQGALQERIQGVRSRLTRQRHFDEFVVDRSTTVTLTVLGAVALICLASAMSHQLTPYAIVLALAACLLTRRLGWPELVVFATLFALGWLSLGASDFWVGHLSTIFGSVGQLGSTLHSNVSARVTGSRSHRLIVDARILITAALYLLAGVGVLIRRPRTRTLEALAATPFLLLAAGSYGGEGLLRVALFGLPFTSLLAASALMNDRQQGVRSTRRRARSGRPRRHVVRNAIVVVVLLGFSFATFAVRGGNDAYESFSTGELAAANYVYDHLQSGETIGTVIYYLPLGQRDIGSANYFSAAAAGGVPTLHYDERQLLLHRPPFIILSASQAAWGTIVEGYPSGWESGLETSLLQHGYYVAARWPTATVLRPVAAGG